MNIHVQEVVIETLESAFIAMVAAYKDLDGVKVIQKPILFPEFKPNITL